MRPTIIFLLHKMESVKRLFVAMIDRFFFFCRKTRAFLILYTTRCMNNKRFYVIKNSLELVYVNKKKMYVVHLNVSHSRLFIPALLFRTPFIEKKSFFSCTLPSSSFLFLDSLLHFVLCTRAQKYTDITVNVFFFLFSF